MLYVMYCHSQSICTEINSTSLWNGKAKKSKLHHTFLTNAIKSALHKSGKNKKIKKYKMHKAINSTKTYRTFKSVQLLAVIKSKDEYSFLFFSGG